MSCASCAISIEVALKKEKGVFSVNVNFALEKMNIEFEPNEITFSEIKKIVQKTGYKVIEENEEIEGYIEFFYDMWINLVDTNTLN